MSQPDGKIRPWRQIARELAEERDSQRILALPTELNNALLAQGTDAALVEPHQSRPSTTTDSGKATNDYDRSVSENSSIRGDGVVIAGYWHRCVPHPSDPVHDVVRARWSAVCPVVDV
jgi:hypothetical protein